MIPVNGWFYFDILEQFTYIICGIKDIEENYELTGWYFVNKMKKILSVHFGAICECSS